MKRLTNFYIALNIYFKLIPFLILYSIICIVFVPNEIIGDEGRYLDFAHNLTRGYYSPPYPEINLWNGPGYPILIAPLLLLKFPLIALRLLNVFLLYFSLIFSYKTVRVYSSKNSALFFTIILGLYFPIIEQTRLILTETLAWFLISLICFLFVKSYQQEKISWTLITLSAFAIAYLAMTKVIFGYIILIMLFASISAFLIPAFRSSAKKSTIIFLLSFIFCLPWLFYTYSLTNRLFYWSNSGSMSLYTMSTPYSNELGDWSTINTLQQNPNHKVFIDSIVKLKSLQRDDAFKTAAIENIGNHPQKYASNWIANVGRLFFSYPYSNTEQKITSYFYIIPNMFFIVIITLILPISFMNYIKFPVEMIFLFLFVVIYLFGSSLVSAYTRMFYITIPFWILFIAFVFNNIISVNIKQSKNLIIFQ